MRESDIILLLNYMQGVPRRSKHVPGRGDLEPVDEYQILVTGAQRNLLVEALRCYHPQRLADHGRRK